VSGLFLFWGGIFFNDSKENNATFRGAAGRLPWRHPAILDQF
jgi:hypothetical protein